jgi:hypothetical protein
MDEKFINNKNKNILAQKKNNIPAFSVMYPKKF